MNGAIVKENIRVMSDIPKEIRMKKEIVNFSILQ